jgi:hypothetical protein
MKFTPTVTSGDLKSKAREIFVFFQIDFHQYENTNEDAEYVDPINNE